MAGKDRQSEAVMRARSSGRTSFLDGAEATTGDVNELPSRGARAVKPVTAEAFDDWSGVADADRRLRPLQRNTPRYRDLELVLSTNARHAGAPHLFLRDSD